MNKFKTVRIQPLNSKAMDHKTKQSDAYTTKPANI